MRVLVSGATGFLGRKAVARLLASGHEVVALTRSPSKAKEILPSACRIFQWNGESEAVPKESLVGVEAVLHLAGEGVADEPWTKARKKKILYSRTHSTRSLVKAAQGLSPALKVFVSASAIGFYGDTGDEIVDEDTRRGMGFLAEVCQEWEEELKPLQGVRKVVLRTGVVLGRDGGALKKIVPLFQWGLGGRLGSGKQWMSWIHCDDIVSLCLWALENPDVEGVLNGVAPHPVTNAEFSKRLGKALHRPSWLPAPAFALEFLLGERASFLLGSQRVHPKRARLLGFPFAFPTLEKALANLFS